MKITYNWLKDFVDIKTSAQKLADKLTMSGLEVTSLESQEGDFILEIEVTSNRPDWLSVIGLAREVAAITGTKLRLPIPLRQRSTVNGRQTFNIKIENYQDCPLYTAKIIRGVKVGPSPDWLKKRLELIGCRSINNVVDITNYVMFERGEPLHAFDLARLKADTIIVRRAKDGEKITTIDKEERLLNPGILVIADTMAPVAVAGIMGGKDSEVTEDTCDILLEAAVFEPALIRRGIQALGIKSESSYRFERGINMAVVEAASLAAAKLIQDICGATLSVSKKAGPGKTKIKKLTLEASSVGKILGAPININQVKNILKSLDFKVKTQARNNLSVEIPSHRQDVDCPIDLIEEIARIYGFENIPSTFPEVLPQPVVISDYDLLGQLKNVLVGLGLNEAITYSLWSKDLSGIAPVSKNQSAEIINPLNSEQEILRTSLLPNLATCVAYNLNQKQEKINIFEIAKTYYLSGGQPKEELKLGIALCGPQGQRSEHGGIKDQSGILHLKGIIETIFERLGINNYRLLDAGNGRDFDVYANGAKAGLIFKAPGDILNKLDIKNKDVFLLELSLEIILRQINLEKKFVPLPVYPGISRDISLIIKETVRADEMLQNIRERCRGILQDIRVIDYYKGKQIPRGFKGLTLSCFYRSNERTLTESEINPSHSRVIDLLAKEFGAHIRA